LYTGPYARHLEFPPGEPTHNLIRLARDGLRTKLREAVEQAIHANERVVTEVRVRRDGGDDAVRVTVSPVSEPKAPEGLLLVTFEGETSVPPAFPQATAGSGGVGEATALRQVEYELTATREHLESAIEDREASNAELTSLNAELLSANQELQSANEELNTSKEELQSVNEELGAVNNQLRDKVDELEKVNNDMANLLRCTEVVTVFLDAGQRIKLFTPSATRVFNLIAADLGRPLRDITAKLADPDLQRDTEDVLRDLAPRETEVRTEDGRWYMRRITPYRTTDERIDGVVIMFVEITERKRADQALRDREERLQAILNTVADAVLTIDRRGIIRSANRATERMFAYTAAEMLGQNVTMLMSSPYREAHDGYIARYLKTGEKHILGTSREVEARRKDGSVFPVDLAVSEIAHLGLFTGVHRDLTERKQLERDVVEAASLEQRRIGQDLHDSAAQELTALNLLVRDLTEILRTDPRSAPPLVERLAQGLQRGQEELRAVLRGLLPVAVDSEGLMAALADLADRTQREGKVTCTLDCPQPVTVEDNLIATHLYLIAQEAVHNAVKHGRPRNIRIGLRANHRLMLTVQDDGTGMAAEPAASQGMGLRIMRNRAAIIGATLTVGPAEPGGTVVTCALLRRRHEREKTEAGPGPDRR
jgi:two-component system CheB/CheR fusion protein